MSNERMRDYWAAGGAEPWVQHAELYDAELAGFADALEDTLPVHDGMRLLDVGCGAGALLERAAARGAIGVGVDISPAMVGAATVRVPSATVVVADAQTDDLASYGPFEGAMSRFGVMFFDDPAAAFANIRGAVTPGGPLAFVCWRGSDENQMFSLGTSVLLDRLDELGLRPDPPPPGSPGPMSLADPDRIRTVLSTAGWSDVSAEKLDVPIAYGHDGEDGVEERMVMVLGNGTGRLAAQELEPRLGPEKWAELLDEVRAELRRHLVDG